MFEGDRSGTIGTDQSEQGIVHPLDEPDQPRHGARGHRVQENQQEFHIVSVHEARYVANLGVFTSWTGETVAMRPVFCLRLEGPTWPESQRSVMRDITMAWLEQEHPADEREAGLSVRIDDEDIERWWRCSIDRPIGDGAMSGTTITLATSESGTSFEIRCTVTPGGRRVSPRPPTVSVTSLRVLARSIVAKCAVYDAGMKLRPDPSVVDRPDGAEAIAAFCDAPGRVLPVIIETVPDAGRATFDVARLSLTLSGLAHIIQIHGDASVAAFNRMYGRAILVKQGLTLVWPAHAGEATSNGQGLSAEAGARERTRIVNLITDSAALSIAPLRAPLFRRRVTEVVESVADKPATRQPEPEPVPSTVTSTVVSADPTADPENVPWSEYRAVLEQWQEDLNRLDDLEQAMAEADRVIAEKQELLENRNDLVETLVLMNTELEVRLGRSPQGLRAANAFDAVTQASRLCEHLTFHENAFTTARALENVDANRLLKDLVRLNVVAADWQTGRINNVSLTISCRSLGLNYAPGVSDTAEYKFGSDYAFTWRGRTEFALAHIRNGKGSSLYRVHLFFDEETHQVVVAYVGRHLRGKYG